MPMGRVITLQTMVVGYGPTQRDATDAAHIALGLRVPTRAEVEHDRHVVAARLGWSRRRARSQ
ncbi:MAG: hypothetical protein ACHREM_28765 [Polyangiales bacterium]